jgi:hypothetical protein
MTFRIALTCIFLTVPLAFGAIAQEAPVLQPDPERVNHAPVIAEGARPRTPPLTVEGEFHSYDAQERVLHVDSKSFGLVRIGVPPDLPVMRNREYVSPGEIREGDRIFATITTVNGNRALHVVANTPMNPLINWIGIPILLLIAAALWWTGRRRGTLEREDIPRGRPRTGPGQKG